MDTRLEVFVAAALHQNFSRAAEQLFISQPAVSQQISALEQEMGATLFDREARSVKLTKAGEVVFHHSQQILQMYAQMHRLVNDLAHAPQGTLTIGASYTYGEYMLPHVLAPFLNQFPGIVPVISIANSKDIEQRVAEGSLDVGIIEKASVHKSVQAEAFATDVLRIVASPQHAGLAEDQLSDQVWIVREPGSGTRDMTDAFFALHGVTARAIMEFSSTQVIKEAVEAGLGIALLSEWTIRKEGQGRTLAVLPWPSEPMKRDFSLLLRKSEFATKATLVFAHHIRTKGVPG